MVSVLLSLSLFAAPPPTGFDSPFGVCLPWSGLAETGVRWTRCGAGASRFGSWPYLHVLPYQFHWQTADDELRAFYDPEGLHMLVVLGYTPRWCSTGPKGEPAYPPDRLEHLRTFVRAIVSRYKERVRYWEVWNEPNIGFFQGSERQYVDMLKTAYVAAKQADPNCRIVFGGTAGVDIPFVERCYEYGAKGYFDVMAVHPYQWGTTFNDGWFADLIKQQREQLLAHGDDKSIWVTEVGWSTGDAGITEDIQAELLAQALVTSLALRHLRLEKTFWFSVKDWGKPGHGLFRDDGGRKPAFTALKVVIGQLDGATYWGTLDLGPNVRGHVFERDGKTVVALWSADRKERDVTLRLGEGEAEVTDLSGTSQRQATAKSVLKLAAAPAPVFVRPSGNDTLKQVTPAPPSPEAPVRYPPMPPGEGVWLSLHEQPGTSRPWAVRGQATELILAMRNHSDRDRRVMGEVTLRQGGQDLARLAVPPTNLAGGDEQALPLSLAIPADAQLDLGTLELRAWLEGPNAQQVLVPGLDLPVRIADGPCIEFNANSFVERQYLWGENTSGTSPSTRFGGTWTYRFELPQANGGELRLRVGANQAQAWQVALSRDGKQFGRVLQDRSWPDWHSVSLDRYVPGTVYVRFTGNDQQLRELILLTRL